ncbi:MAG: SRPBCC domain-containing protein [Flavobacteriales bacterium]|nr:SRPBCC domain-containing protein [Flavobacteriales bacterium]
MSEANNRTVTLKRTFNAPIKLVWEAWTQPEHIAHWWSPDGLETKVVEHDFKVGGNWRYTMEMQDGNLFIANGVYTEIVEFEKIFSSANFKPMTEGVEIQALFEENGDKTNFTFNIVHPTEEYRIQQEKMGILNGWGSVFERLDTLVSKLNS